MFTSICGAKGQTSILGTWRLLLAGLLLLASSSAWAAIAIDVTTSRDQSTRSTTVTTPSFSTTSGNELLLALIATDYNSGTNTTVTSVTGAGLTWVLAVRTNVQSGTAEIWRAFAPAPLTSVTATATLSQSVASSITVMSFTGVDGSGTNGSGAIGATRSANGASGAPTGSLVTTRDNSWVFGVANDFDKAIARTPGTSQSVVHQYLATVGDTYWVQRQNSATPLSGTTVTINDTAPTTDRYNLSIVAIVPTLNQTSAPDLTVRKTHAGNFTQGQSGAGYSITATNSGGLATSGTVTVTDTLPGGLTAAAISGTNWTCTLATLTCTRSDTLAAGASYPVITLNVNVASTAPASVTNTATVSGGGETNTSNDSAADITTINPPPDLTIAKTHSGNFVQGQTGATYTITATNSGGAATSGTVAVTDTLPPGLTASAMSGTNWTCTLATLTCTRSDALAAGASYPAITLSVNVAGNAPASVTNTVSVSGGGETNTSNDTASDVTIVNPPSDLTITKSHTGNFVQGQTGAAYTITATNSGGAVTSGTVAVTDTLPPGLTASAMSGTNWICTLATLTCTRSDALAAGASYPAITLSVNVAGNAPASVTNTVSVSGGGEINTSNDTASDITGVDASPDLTIAKSHSGNFVRGQTGATYTITATNSGGAPTTASVTVTDTLPAGLTATAIGGLNWNCTLMTLTCTRTDVLAAGASYPAITLTVDIASTAPASVTNRATISGGGETNLSNDTANDITSVTGAGVLTHVGGASGHPVVTNQVMTFNYTPVGTNNALVVLIGCRSPGITAMSLTAPGWTFTPISGLVGPSANSDFISTLGAITPNTAPVTFTVTLTGGNGNCTSNDTTVLVDEFSGNDVTGGTTTFDAHKESLDSAPSGTCTGAPVTPLNDNDAIWYACFDNVTGVSGGYTKGQDDSTGDWSEYKILSGGSGVVQNPGFTTNPSFSSFGLGGVSIKAAAQASGPDLTVSKTHSGSFTQRQIGAAYSITVANTGGTSTSGTVTMTDTLPAGLTATGIGGTNWACTLATLTCTRNDPLAAGASYPIITVTVSVASNAPASVTNTVAVSGGGETNTANDTAADVTNIATTSQTGITLIQSNVNGNENATSNMSVSFASSNVQGDFLIVTGSAARPATTLSISDTLGNSYTPAIGPVTDPAQNVTIYIWYVPVCKGGANTVTITPSTTAALEIHVSEWSGLATASPVDQTISAAGAGTSVSSTSQTTTMSGELIFGYGWVMNSASAGAGFTPINLVNGDLDEYQIQATAGSVAATFTQTSGTWFALMATFKPAGSDTTFPTVSLTAPANGATVTDVTTVSATATDDTGVAGVQFQLDGGNLGAEVTSSPYSVTWDTSTVVDGPHNLTAIARDTAGNRTTSATAAVTVSNASNPAVVGQWSAPFDVGIVAVNSIMLHTGKVLMYSGSFTASYVERVWDPATGDLTLVPNPFYDLFCSGQSQLPDGRILVVGGFDSANLGAANANIFDPVTQTWSALPNMTYRRWYPTATTLPDGRVLVTSGAQTCLTCLADVPEVFDPVTGRFSTLPSARLGVPYYPFMFVLPDGTVIDAGANENPVATSKLDVTAGTWTTVDPIVRDGHSAVMYRLGKILKSGTAADSGTAGNAAATAYVLDATQPAPAWRQVASMAFPRAFQNTTLLPDGTVLVTGGGTALDGYDVTKAVRHAELWSATSESWRTLSSASIPRLYHSTALLLPDGRVLTAGSGNDGPAVDQTQAEIFSPPYLFKGARPTISSAPDLVQYGAAFSVSTPDAASIASVALIRPGAVTHAFDQDQRFLSLGFTAGSGSLTIQAPANANLAPPGYYMLFLLNSAGAPSIASFVQLPASIGDREPPTPPTGLAAQGAIGSASLTWGASSDNTGVALYNIYRSTTSGFQPSSANRVGQSTSTSFTNSAVAAGTYYYVVTAQDVAGNASGPSNEASAMVLADTTPPTVTITTPAESATVTGSISVSATASDDVGVAGVLFQLDGQALGNERTTPPYSLTWNSTTTSNGPHVLTAVARDAAGNHSQATVDVVVSNTSQTPSGLVAAYGFNDGSGVQATDASGQNNTGTISNATWTTAGKFGNALSFNGTSAWVTVADAASLDLTNGMTIEAWVNPASGTGWRSVVLKESAGGLAYALYSANNASRPAGYVHTTGDVALNGTAALPLNTWTHLALTYDGAAMRMFVNGAQVSTKALTGSAPVTASALRIGGNSVWGEYFKGLIDEVRVYNRALNGGEIQADMNTPIP